MQNAFANALKNIKHVHFIGIGGSGMFALVQIMHQMGYSISGSDNNETDTTIFERNRLQIPVVIGHSADNIKGADLIVYTAAIPNENEELQAAFSAGVPVYERADFLGLFSQSFHNIIGVAGTHGKTTTSAMLTQILLAAEKDPSVVIGGKLPLIGGSGKYSGNDLLVAEACEFKDHFLKLKSTTSIILNVDADHLEYFGSLENIIRSFKIFAKNTSDTIIANGDNLNTRKALAEVTDKKIFLFGFGTENDFYAENIAYQPDGSCIFTAVHRGHGSEKVTLHIPGRHNILNALAAIAAAVQFDVSLAQAAKALADFHGAGRRFEILGKTCGITIADDYAHHPAELEATLRAAKEMPFAEVWAVFQPFTFSRTKILFDDFVDVLKIPDHVILAPIMGGREQNTYGISSEDLSAKIPGSVVLQTFEEIAQYALSGAKAGDLIITLGCGDINKCAQLML